MKSFGQKPWVLPQPVLIIGTYNADGTPNAMNAAWGGQWDAKEIMICMGTHATTENLARCNDFTVAFATRDTMVASDFVGIVSAKNDPEKMQKTGWTAVKAENVDAPVFTDFPMTLECRILRKIDETPDGYNIVAEIVNILVDEKYVGADGKPDVEKMQLITYDPVHHGYLALGGRIGNAFADGKKLKSYSEFKRRAREHQVKFREDILGVGYNQYPNVLSFADARKGLVFYEGFRKEILEELKKTIPITSSAPSGQMLTNLLRSEHIPYNIFFPMRKDRNGCKDLFNHVLGKEEIQRVTDIKIEHHPEPKENYLSDHTAFDVYISYIDIDNKECGIGIEIKYTEKEYALKEGTSEYSHVKDEHGNTRLFAPYLNATNNSKYFKDDVSHEILVTNKFRQIWRNHILGASMVLHGDIEKFTSITIYPKANVHFHNDAMPKYYELLSEMGQGTFIPLTYEELFDLMDKYLNVENGKQWNMYLKQRYLF